MPYKEFDRREIGKKLRQIRLDRGFSQVEMGQAVGFTDRSVRRIESGKAMSIEIIEAYARYLDVSAYDIL